MGVYIPKMEMPEECRGCPFETYYFHAGETRCRATGNTLAENFERIPFDGRAAWCPLIELPPHGRLIDADALVSESRKYFEDIKRVSRRGVPRAAEAVYRDMLGVINNAPTIIEAEEGE